MFMYQSNRRFNIPFPGTPQEFDVFDVFVVPVVPVVPSGPLRDTGAKGLEEEVVPGRGEFDSYTYREGEFEL